MLDTLLNSLYLKTTHSILPHALCFHVGVLVPSQGNSRTHQARDRQEVLFHTRVRSGPHLGLKDTFGMRSNSASFPFKAHMHKITSWKVFFPMLILIYSFLCVYVGGGESTYMCRCMSVLVSMHMGAQAGRSQRSMFIACLNCLSSLFLRPGFSTDLELIQRFTKPALQTLLSAPLQSWDYRSTHATTPCFLHGYPDSNLGLVLAQMHFKS